MATLLNTDQKVKLTITPITSTGKPAKIDGVPVWESSDTAVIVITPSSDGLSCDAVTTDEIGTAIVTVTIDADLGSGVENISATADIEVVHVRATNLGLVVGTPESK